MAVMWWMWRLSGQLAVFLFFYICVAWENSRNPLSFHSIRTTTKIWVVKRHQYGISALVTQTSFCEGSSGDLAKRWLFSQANLCAFTDFINPPTPLEIRRLCLCLFQRLFFSFYSIQFSLSKNNRLSIICYISLHRPRSKNSLSTKLNTFCELRAY